MDDEKWRELDDVRLLADLPGPLAEIALELLDSLLLQIHFQTLPETGPDQTNVKIVPSIEPRVSPVGVLRQGESEVGELPVGDGLSHTEAAFHHRSREQKLSFRHFTPGPTHLV